MSYTISYSSEVMTSFLQGSTLSPEAKFQAVQGPQAQSLLFSIGTDGVFYVTAEVFSNGTAVDTQPDSSTGWVRSDLSSALKSQFPAGTKLRAKTFDVSQDMASGRYSAALVLNAGSSDYLYMATAANQEDSGQIALSWKAVPFDATAKSYQSILIDNVYTMQMANAPLIVVDIQADGRSTIERYYIDSAQSMGGGYWYLYSLPVNMDAEGVQLCGGRKSGEMVDGIYTCGTVGGVASVFYQEIYSPYNPQQAGTTSQLLFDNPATPIAIASTISVVQNSSASVTYTDLYVATNEGDLYWFAANKQFNNAPGAKLMNNELFVGVNNLFAYTTDSKVVVWGLNRNQQVFYTQCPIASVANASAWSYPVPIASQVEQVSPYVNRVNGGNTYFAHIGANTLKKVFQDPNSTCWSVQNIVLPVDSSKASQPFDCYMSRMTVTDETNTLVTNALVDIWSSYSVPVFINNHYYVLNPQEDPKDHNKKTKPITVTTDAAGGIKIVQAIENLQGACLYVQSHAGGPMLTINPMDTSAAKIAVLNTSDSLASAQVASDNGQQSWDLVDKNSTSASDYQNAAASIQSLSDAYANYNTGTNYATTQMKRVVPGGFAYNPESTKVYSLAFHSTQGLQLNVVSSVDDALSDLGNAIVVAAGDLCSWLNNAVDYVIQVVEDTAQKVWNFVANIAGKIYTFVVNSIEKAIAALEAIFQALKTLVKDLIQFVKFLFSWDDISYTKNVVKNSILLFINESLSSLQTSGQNISKSLTKFKQSIDEWADLPATSTNEYGSQPLTYPQSEADVSSAYSTPNTYMMDHFTNNVANATFSEDDNPILSTVEAVINTFLNALNEEEDAIKAAINSFYSAIIENDRYKTMSLVDILKTIMGIIAETILDTIEIVVEALISLIIELAEGFIALLDQPIWIPVVSDILAHFGLEINSSLLDIFCYMGAIPGTIIYKLLRGQAPFSADDGYSSQIAYATSYNALMDDFGSTDPTSFDPSKEFYSDFVLPQEAKDTIFIVAHAFSSVGALVYALLVPISSLVKAKPLSISTSLASALQTVGYTASGVFSKPYPIQNETVASLASWITNCKLLSSIIFAGATKIAKSEATQLTISYANGAVKIVLNLLAIAPVVYHFVELAEGDQNDFTLLAYMDESAKVCNYISGVAGGIALVDPEPDTKEIVALASSICAAINGGIQMVESFTDVVVNDY